MTDGLFGFATTPKRLPEKMKALISCPQSAKIAVYSKSSQ